MYGSLIVKILDILSFMFILFYLTFLDYNTSLTSTKLIKSKDGYCLMFIIFLCTP